MAALEGVRHQSDHAETVDAGDDPGRNWRAPRRRPRMPNAGVVTVEEQPDEEHAFGPAAPLVAEWRKLRTGAVTSGRWVETGRGNGAAMGTGGGDAQGIPPDPAAGERTVA